MTDTNCGLSRRELSALKKSAETVHAKDQAYKKDSDRGFYIYLIAVLLIALSVRLFIFEPVRVDGDSMYDTLLDGERMFVEKVSLWFAPPERGEIVTCFYPGYTVTCVKRVIAVAGDTVEVTDGRIYLNGEAIDESAYWDDTIFDDMPPLKVKSGTVFVVGDNRNASKDSRARSVGCIPYCRIVGRVRSVIWPIANSREV